MPGSLDILCKAGGGAIFVDGVDFAKLLIGIGSNPLSGKAPSNTAAVKICLHTNRLTNMAKTDALVGAVHLVTITGDATSTPGVYLQSGLPPSFGRFPHIFVLPAQASSDGPIMHTDAEFALDVFVYAQTLFRRCMYTAHETWRAVKTNW